MKIGPVPAPTAQRRIADARQAARAEAQRQMAEMRAAQSRTGEDNPRAQYLISKFKNGQNLTPEEMAYLRRHAPGMIQYIEEVQRERELVRQSLRVAPTKMEVHLTAAHAAKHAARRGDAEDAAVRARHIADVHREYMRTEEYEKKPNGPADGKKKPVGLQWKRKSHEDWISRTTTAMLAYEFHAKMKTARRSSLPNVRI